MPIEKKPEEIIIDGPELEAAVTDGIQRAIGRRVGKVRVTFNGVVSDLRGLDAMYVTVDVVGSLKGPKPGGKRKPPKKPAPPAAPSSAS